MRPERARWRRAGTNMSQIFIHCLNHHELRYSYGDIVGSIIGYVSGVPGVVMAKDTNLEILLVEPPLKSRS